MNKISIQTIKTIIFSGIIIALIAVSYRIYNKTFYYTNKDITPFANTTYRISKPLNISDGVWLHRVNSPERARYFLNSFSGFEMDIYYDDTKNIFNIDHDNRDYNTTLYDMLSVIKEREHIWIWLDFKNLNTNNKEKAKIRLNELISTFSIPKDHIIVESPAIEQLKIFTDEGYVTSFYFTPPSGEAWREKMELLRARFYASGVTAVSSDLRHHDIVKAAFSNVPWLFWDMKSYNRRNILTFIAGRIRRLLLFNEPNVRVLLVGEKELLR